jgi:hypothetical protein
MTRWTAVLTPLVMNRDRSGVSKALAYLRREEADR